MALELNLPEPVRSRVLIEIASDLEALFEHHLSRGLPDEEAARRAEETVLASPAEVHRLVSVHAGGAQRWLVWLSGRVRRDLDLFLFVMGVLPALSLAGLVLAPRLSGPGGGPFAWLLLLVAAVVLGISLLKFRQLFLRGDAALAELRTGLSEILFLGWIAPAIGALGFLIQLHSLSVRLSLDGAPERGWTAAAEPLGHSAALLGAAILLAIAVGILWLVLVNRLAALEQTERAFLLDE